MIRIKSFLKWPGNKYRILETLLPRLPKGKRLVEPFVGSGVIFLNTRYEAYLLCDKNADLIALYTMLYDHGDAFIAYCKALFTPEANTLQQYYQARNTFNNSNDAAERARLFLYLNRHGYNGLVRYNRAGAFNVPFGRYDKPYFPETEMRMFIQQCQECVVEFQVADFQETYAQLGADDVVYADPPYAPLTPTANFTGYAGGFSFDAQRCLADLARVYTLKGIPTLLSNHDTPEIRRLYKGASIKRFHVQRNIACTGHSRTKAPELLALFKQA